MLNLTLYILISNAILKQDKLILIIYIITYLNSFDLIIKQIFLIIILLSAILIIFINLFDFTRVLTVIFILSSYIYSIFNFLYWCDLNYMNIIFQCLIISMSLITSFILVRNGIQKSSLFDTYIRPFLLPGFFITTFIFTIYTIINFRYAIFNSVDYHVPFNVCAFIMYSLTIPKTILFRIIYNIFLWCLIIKPYQNINFFLIVYIQVTKKKNYQLDNIRISRTILLLYIILPLGDIVYELIYISFENNNNLAYSIVGVENLYTSYNFEKKSWPESVPYIEEVDISHETSMGENELIMQGAKFINRETSDSITGKSLSYRCIYEKEDWVRHSSNLWYREWYIKSRFTSQISNFIVTPNLNFYFKLDPHKDYTLNVGVRNAIEKVTLDEENESQDESLVDSIIATLLPTYFGVDRGYSYCPQLSIEDPVTFDRGKADYAVSYDGSNVLIVEDKTSSGNSMIDLLIQGTRYARCNRSLEVSFLAIVKGTKISFFMYDMDWHTSHGFDLKLEGVQDAIGLQVNSEGIVNTPQFNTVYPQMRIYDLSINAPYHNRLAITSILTYISRFKEGVSIRDDFMLPDSASPSNTTLGTSRINSTGLNLRLQLDPYGKFKHASY